MQAFLKKINNNYEYKQYLPNKTIKKKGDSKTISSKISGLTGSAKYTLGVSATQIAEDYSTKTN